MGEIRQTNNDSFHATDFCCGSKSLISSDTSPRLDGALDNNGTSAQKRKYGFHFSDLGGEDTQRK